MFALYFQSNTIKGRFKTEISETIYCNKVSAYGHYGKARFPWEEETPYLKHLWHRRQERCPFPKKSDWLYKVGPAGFR